MDMLSEAENIINYKLSDPTHEKDICRLGRALSVPDRLQILLELGVNLAADNRRCKLLRYLHTAENQEADKQQTHNGNTEIKHMHFRVFGIKYRRLFAD